MELALCRHQKTGEEGRLVASLGEGEFEDAGEGGADGGRVRRCLDVMGRGAEYGRLPMLAAADEGRGDTYSMGVVRRACRGESPRVRTATGGL